uniref:Ras modification protein ERF4 n=1 Tax=Paramoeba aestuarina TaxID=180227 RepID=A0A7S4KGN6_9EUKA|mmetsp:Transcript_18901/g.29647  ORF Transcript_18901/g.29647 Transcript_18901/m.29647 type:complete len:132 (+) Transcript_18901:123-518(+)
MAHLVNWPGIPPTSVLIPRDYEESHYIKFHTQFPVDLNGAIDEDIYQNTIETINQILHQADEYNLFTFLEGLVACSTFWTIYLCYGSTHARIKRQLDEFLENENTKNYNANGYHINCPLKNGLLFIEISRY